MPTPQVAQIKQLIGEVLPFYIMKKQLFGCQRPPMDHLKQSEAAIDSCAASGRIKVSFSLRKKWELVDEVGWFCSPCSTSQNIPIFIARVTLRELIYSPKSSFFDKIKRTYSTEIVVYYTTYKFSPASTRMI